MLHARHHLTNRLARAVVSGLSAIACCVSPAAAQNDHTLFDSAWPEGEYWARTFDQLWFIPSGHLDGTDQDIDIFAWDSFGKFRVDRNDADPGVFFGYRILAITLGGSDLPSLPGDLNDVSLTAAFRLTEDDADWRVSLLAGGGTANDGHWDNTDALYGIGALDFSNDLGSDRMLHVGIEYYGNRSYWPDIPVPYVSFDAKLGSSFWYRVGFPNCGVKWDIGNGVSLEGQWTFEQRVKATAGLELSEAFGLFAEYESTIDGFHTEDSGHNRLFYEASRVTAGVRWKASWIDAQFGAGWAFDQEFSSGFDIWDTDTVASPSDEIVIMLVLRGTF